jgi:hypothetical protein
MTWQPPFLNLVLAWAWLVAGFGSGALLGLRFAGDHWLGGYASLRRRMYRLGHISFFGLGFVNLAFYLTVQSCPPRSSPLLAAASWALVIGALTMPPCCLILAHHARIKPVALFALPVGALLAGGALTLWRLLTS